MNRARAIIRYDGPALAGHEMDVRELAPALLALEELCRTANEIFNGNNASVRLVVRADVDQKCFQLQIDLVQTIFEQMNMLLAHEKVQNAKNIFEWIGIIGGGTWGLFGLYKAMFGGRSSNPQISIIVKDGMFLYTSDDTEIPVPPEVHRLFQEHRMFAATKRLLAPLGKSGYERLEFEQDGRTAQYFTREEARSITQTSDDAIVVKDGNYLVSTYKTTVRVRKAIYEGQAKWGIMHKRAVEAKMDDNDWLSDFQSGIVQAPPGSHLIVDLEERTPIDLNGEPSGEASYVIKKVHGVVPPMTQMRLPWPRID